MASPPQPVLRNAWSAATLLAGIQHMDNDVLQSIKKELPDDPQELARLCQVRCFELYNSESCVIYIKKNLILYGC